MEVRDSLNLTKPDFGTNPINFFKEIKTELSKVSWPKKETVIRLTLVVVGVSALVGIYLGGLDFAFAKAIEIILAQK